MDKVGFSSMLAEVTDPLALELDCLPSASHFPLGLCCQLDIQISSLETTAQGFSIGWGWAWTLPVSQETWGSLNAWEEQADLQWWRPMQTGISSCQELALIWVLPVDRRKGEQAHPCSPGGEAGRSLLSRRAAFAPAEWAKSDSGKLLRGGSANCLLPWRKVAGEELCLRVMHGSSTISWGSAICMVLLFWRHDSLKSGL